MESEPQGHQDDRPGPPGTSQLSSQSGSQSGSQRFQDAQRRVELAENAARAEAEEAQKLIDGFIAEANRRGVAPEPLRATTYSGASVKTDKVGWYLRKNHSLAIGTDGSYYVMTVPGGWAEKFRGVRLQPTPPPMVIGRGGRDGETGDLAEFLQWRLDEG